MESENLLPIAILSILIGSVILSFIISYATQSKKKMKHAEAQTLLLIEIAMKQGVDPDQLKKIMGSLEEK